MKKSVFGIIALGAVLFGACKDKATVENGNNTENTTEEVATTPETEVASTITVVTDNVGKYPKEIKFFESNANERIQKITGDLYTEIIANFNVETPIVEENSIYMFTGCKQNSCPEFKTTIVYDKNNDNFNVIVDKNGTISTFKEKEEIKLTDSLKSK